MPIETALQRADQFIQKQMDKFEQQRKGRTSPKRAYAGYGQLPPQQDYPYSQPPSQSHWSPVRPPHPPDFGPMAPPGWRQEFDTSCRCWYYINLSTGRWQWEPPHPPHPPNSQPPCRSQTLGSESPRHREYVCTSQPSERSVSQSQAVSSSCGGSCLCAYHPGINTSSDSPYPSPPRRLPPGVHFDMKTGQLESSMFPPGQDPKLWAYEVGRI
ncbi:hypothetical protein J1614_003274 [Plenodomus biglobosus]|nr:hypothetical protein J1614_003274 [Plenodomus biglobosus]